MDWQPIETAPKDGTWLILFVDYRDDEDADHPLEDAEQARTIGSNNFDNDGEDKWEFVGWCWSHDHFVRGYGTPTHWMPLPAPPTQGESK